MITKKLLNELNVVKYIKNIIEININNPCVGMKQYYPKTPISLNYVNYGEIKYININLSYMKYIKKIINNEN